MNDPSEAQTQAPPLAHGSLSVQRTGSTSPRARAVDFPAAFRPGSQFVLNLTPEAADELNELLARTGETPTQLFQKALGLYKATRQAIEEGKAVGIAETPESLETQFVGI